MPKATFSAPYRYSGENFGVFPLEQTRHVGVAKSELPRLTNGEIIFEEFQPMWSQFTNVTDRQTDRQTTCDRNTALCTKVHRAVKMFCEQGCFKYSLQNMSWFSQMLACRQWPESSVITVHFHRVIHFSAKRGLAIACRLWRWWLWSHR